VLVVFRIVNHSVKAGVSGNVTRIIKIKIFFHQVNSEDWKTLDSDTESLQVLILYDYFRYYFPNIFMRLKVRVGQHFILWFAASDVD